MVIKKSMSIEKSFPTPFPQSVNNPLSFIKINENIFSKTRHSKTFSFSVETIKESDNPMYGR